MRFAADRKVEIEQVGDLIDERAGCIDENGRGDLLGLTAGLDLDRGDAVVMSANGRDPALHQL